MKWQLLSNDEKTKLYQNVDTGSECVLKLIYTDLIGNKWWGFQDLFSMPYQRTAMAKRIYDLYQTGLTQDDLKTWFKKEKELLKSTDPEKYEKLYALVLEKEQIVNSIVDPVKQSLALCTVYILGEDERIDLYQMSEMERKLQVWGMDIDLQSFFLNWHRKHILHYSEGLNKISGIASSLTALKNETNLNQL